MAALLRTARVLKFSPSGLIQITGTNRNGPQLTRLYSGATGGIGLGVCPRRAPEISSASRTNTAMVTPVGFLSRSYSWNDSQFGEDSLNSCALMNFSPGVRYGRMALRCLWPYAGLRSYGVIPEQRGASGDEPSPGMRSKQVKQFDWALAKLDNSVRRTGRITKTLLLRVFHDLCRTGYPTGNQALLLLRSCGSLLPEMPPSERTELAHRIWEKLLEMGASYDASHYNALLKVYLQNDFKFSPTEFLAKMEAANVQPNRVTFQRLIAAYCQEADIEGASTILGFMKSKDLPITEAVFNSLVLGHARAGDLESAENILPVMRTVGIEPGPDTYVALLNAYAEKGDAEKIVQTLQSVESTDTSLTDRDLLQVIFSLAKSGHQDHVPMIAERLRFERGYIPDAMNLCLSLITLGQEDTAFTMLKTFPSLQADTTNTDVPNQGNFFLRHCINMGTPVEKITVYCKQLQDLNLHSTPLQFSLYCSLEANKTGTAVELMKTMKEQGLPIRPHYFWPLLTHHLNEKNTAGVLEVMKGMLELGLSSDSETFTNYVVPAFPNIESACSALKEAGCTIDPGNIRSSEVRSKAWSGNLSELLTMLSDPSFPAMDLSIFRGNLINGFRKSVDLESKAKITALLFKDARFSKEGSERESTAFFLYNLINAMTPEEVKTQEDQLRQYFNLLKSMDITIPVNIYRGIRNLLDSYQTPELIKDVRSLADGDIEALDSPSQFTEGAAKVSALEKKLAELKAEGKPVGPTLKILIQTLCSEDKLDQALELKQQNEDDMVVGGYATLIQLCCRHDNVEEAMNLKREMSRKDSSVALDASKYLSLVKVLSLHGRVEEGIEMLKEMREKEVAMSEGVVKLLFDVLNSATAQGPGAVRSLQDAIFTLGLAKPSANLCSPLVSTYLESKDLAGALEAATESQKQYGQLPRIHDIIVSLVEAGDTEQLQKAMDFVSQERGEMTMMYDLFFGFLQTGRYREARKIIETPGLRARPGRLQWYAQKCITAKKMEPLENMVDMTAKLFECDRDEMYSFVLRLCKETNDWRRAEATWTKMQEENIIPRPRTLRTLADILLANGQEVPFQVPEAWYEQDNSKEGEGEAKAEVTVTKSAGSLSGSDPDYKFRILTLCKKGMAQEAYGVLRDADGRGVALGSTHYNSLIKVLLSEGSMEDAMVVKDIAVSRIPEFHLSDVASSLLVITQAKRDQVQDAMATMKAMLQSDKIPTQLSITRLVQALGRHGDSQGIEEVQSLMKTLGVPLNLSSMLFVNNIALAHIKSGDLQGAVEALEAVYTQASEGPVPSMSFVFRKVLEENNEAAVDKLSSMAERLANHFASYRAASDLFLQLLEMNRVEDAKFMLARCNAVAEQKEVLMSYMSRMAQKPGQVGKIKALVSLIPDFTDKKTIYAYLMKCHNVDKDLEQAKSLYLQMKEEGVEVNDLTLKRLAEMYRNAGETPPFTEPPESFKFYAEKLREGSKVQPGTPAVE